jgi:DNA-directed RNA polymerase subunit RPC12/RpoP
MAVVMKCGQCAGRLRRVHRTFAERFQYMAIYECPKCEREEYVPRRYRYHLGPACRCPLCGTHRVSKRRSPDRIDRFHSGFLNLLERIAGSGQLYHCRWCRIQFYDRRPLSSEAPKHEEEQAALETANPANTGQTGVA